MNAIGVPVHLPASLEKEASRLADEDGVSLSHWVSLAVAQKIGAVETAAQFLSRRSKGSVTADDALAILDGGPHLPPALSDELPADWKRP